MAVLDQMRESGWGALFLFLYVLAIIHWWVPELNEVMKLIGAAIPSLVVVFLSITFNDWLMEVLVGDTIQEAFLEIKEHTDLDEFYWGANEQVQKTVDDLDQRAHRKVVSILAGGVIGVTLPFVGWFAFGILGSLAGIAGSGIILYLLSYRRYSQLGELIKSSVKTYKAEYED